jgi:peroxiredoxin
MTLEKGRQVPAFQLISLDGKVYNNKEMIGKKYMISFYRYASCPFCNLRVSFLMSLHDSLGLDHQMLAIFQSDENDMKQYVANQTPSFPLFSDSERVYYSKFGVETSTWAYIMGALKLGQLIKAYRKGFSIKKSMGPKTTVPADFLVDEKGVIQYAYYGKDISDHLDIDTVEVYFSAH